MRSRILRVATLSVLLAVAVLGLPLLFVVTHLVAADERGELQRLALSSAVRVSPDSVSGDPVELPVTETDTELGVYDSTGGRVSGAGPTHLELAANPALSGKAISRNVGESLVSAVPVTRSERVIAVVRAAEPAAVVGARSWAWFALLGSMCAAAVILARWYAGRESRRIAAPLETLAMAVEDLGRSPASDRRTPSGVEEIDALDVALRNAHARLSEMIARERAFSAQASHQLRTPMTQLQLELERGLETGGAALEEAAASALKTAESLSFTIEDLLKLARGTASSETFDIEELLEDCRERWLGPLAESGRPLRVVVSRPMQAEASAAAVRQVMHVLLDNALKHGEGAVTLQVRESHGAVAIDVIDQGRAAPISIGDDSRIGLPLARSLLLAEGGRLVVDQRGPGTRFTVLLPLAG